MVDGVLLLVDASEGPLPQTRFVLRKALEQGDPVILVVNKVDRDDARIDEVVEAVYELFLDLEADEEQIDFPIIYASARQGWATLEENATGTDLDAAARDRDLARSGARAATRTRRFRRSSRTSTRSPYHGRLAVCRIERGTLKQAQQVAWIRRSGEVKNVKIAALYCDGGHRADRGRRGRGR